MFLLSTVRATADIGTGLISCVVYGITVIQAEFAWPSRVLWTEVALTFHTFEKSVGVANQQRGSCLGSLLSMHESEVADW